MSKPELEIYSPYLSNNLHISTKQKINTVAIDKAYIKCYNLINTNKFLKI